MSTKNRWASPGWGLLVVVLFAAFPGQGQTREQTLALRGGWNAVFLEVDPANPDPESVFSNTPVDVVARYFPRTSPVQYIIDPGSTAWNEPGWGVWYSASRPESIVSSLFAIHGNKPYLVHTPTPCVWKVTGQVTFQRLSWQADSFNLVGFGVDEISPPTFAAFFSGAEGRIGERIYRLDSNGRWALVTQPGTTTIRPGEAYWVSCAGKTDYQGPLEVRIPALVGLDFGRSGSRLEVELFNRSSAPSSLTMEVVPGGGDLPLAQVVQNASLLETSYPDLQPITQLSVAPGKMEGLRLAVRREAMSAARQTRLLKLSTTLGVRFWIPVCAERSGSTTQP